MTLDATRKKSGKKLLVMLSSWDGFISSCLLSQFMASHDFNKSWESITKIHPLVENDDGTVQCGKCATGYEESHEAEECCETCWKCGLRGHNMPDEAEDCCPCSCGGEHGFCETSDVSDEIEQEIFESLAADGAARAKMKAMYGKPPKGMEDYFRRSWDSITKMPFVRDSVREMTPEDVKRYNFTEGYETREPKDDRFMPNKRMIGDYADEESGKTLPIVINKPFKATEEAREKDRNSRRIFGSGLRDGSMTQGFIPMNHLGIKTHKEKFFGGQQQDPAAVLDNGRLHQVWTPKKMRRQGIASSILDAMVEEGRKSGYRSGWLPSAKDEDGRQLANVRTDEKGQETHHTRPWVDAETGVPYWHRSDFGIQPTGGQATKDYLGLMASRGLFPNQIKGRGNDVGEGRESRDPNNVWADEGSQEGAKYFEAYDWGKGGSDSEEGKRGNTWGFDEEQPFLRPTLSTIMERAKSTGNHKAKTEKLMREASDRCPQDGEADPVTGKVHPYIEDSDIKEEDGCDCWDDWREARGKYFAEFPELDWINERYPEDPNDPDDKYADDTAPPEGFHLAEKVKRFNEMIEQRDLIPAEPGVWNDEKDDFEHGGKTTQEWSDHERDLRGD